jgi:hypothetical protein
MADEDDDEDEDESVAAGVVGTAAWATVYTGDSMVMAVASGTKCG